LAGRPDVQPDLIVGHSGFGSTLFLPELYRCPIINYFEYFFRSRNSDIDFRPDFPCRPVDRLRVRARNAMLLLDLENCAAGYSPTHWQQARLPLEYQPKVQVLFDGIDTELWKPCRPADRRIGNWVVPADCKLVTYATRGMEAMRGFDVFLNVAHRISLERADVIFAIAGEDRVVYGGDDRHIPGGSLREYLLSLGNFDRTRFHFLGRLPPADLAKLFSLSDLHFYFTVPFVLSWSLFNALACGTTVLASNAGPVAEIVRDGHNGLLLDFFDEDGFVDMARRVLRDPGPYRELGKAGRQLMEAEYSYDVCLPRLADFYEQTAAQKEPS
jgi:glycosyltransferase involved in cell wall biosynthesis